MTINHNNGAYVNIGKCNFFDFDQIKKLIENCYGNVTIIIIVLIHMNN